jgi:hypothetical protein
VTGFSLSTQPEITSMPHIILVLLFLAGAHAFAQQNEAPKTPEPAPAAHKWYFGELRAYNVEHWYRELKDTRATSFGGNFSLLSPVWHGLSAGGTLSIANNLGTDPKVPAHRISLLPSDNVTILSEAYAKYQMESLGVRGGAFKIDTPYTTPSDAFMIPVTYQGGEVTWKASDKLGTMIAVLNEIKIREDDEFVNTGEYLLTRYGAASRAPRSVALAGARFKEDKYNASAFAYLFDDIMWLGYLDFTMSRSLSETCTGYASVQAGKEQQTGDKLLGSVDSEMVGLKLGMKSHGHDWSVAANHVPESDGFRKGAWLEPFSYFTSTTFTNNMMSGVGNKLPGTAYKAMWLKTFNEAWSTKVSYANLDFKNATGIAGGVWQSEWDWDLQYKFQGSLKGLQILSRLTYMDGGQRIDRVNASRLQISYAF